MAQKSKQILWHKKQGKFLSSKFLSIHGKTPAAQTPANSKIQNVASKTERFARSLAAQIKKAAKDQ
jgi:hypothetical protein